MKVTRSCTQCGTVFTKRVKVHLGHGKFCSNACKFAANVGKYRNREKRRCRRCNKVFWFRLCYRNRPGSPGSFCGSACHLAWQIEHFSGKGNPRAGKYAKYGSKKSSNLRHLEHYQEARKKAFEKLACLWETPIQCIGCGCTHFPVLQVNHRIEFKTKKCGAPLWREVTRLPDAEAKEKYDIRCQICNWAYHLKVKYGHQYQISWKGVQ